MIKMRDINDTTLLGRIVAIQRDSMQRDDGTADDTLLVFCSDWPTHPICLHYNNAGVCLRDYSEVIKCIKNGVLE